MDVGPFGNCFLPMMASTEILYIICYAWVADCTFNLRKTDSPEKSVEVEGT